MKPQSPDTHPDIERMQIEAYRRMTPAEKLRIVGDLNRFAADTIRAQVRRAHPRAGEQEVRLRAASRWLPAALLKSAFGWDPEQKGY